MQKPSASVLLVVLRLGSSLLIPQPIEVPFAFVHNEVLVDVMIDGRGPFTMMLYTGANPSAIDVATADTLGIQRSGKGQTPVGGGTGTNLAFGCKLKDVRLGGLEVASVDAAAIDLSTVSGRLGRHLDGVLGHSLLNKRIVQFDYRTALCASSIRRRRCRRVRSP